VDARLCVGSLYLDIRLVGRLRVDAATHQ